MCYMLPISLIERPYEPPFELPDYQSVGQRLRSLAYHRESDHVPTYDYDVEADVDPASWSLNILEPGKLSSSTLKRDSEQIRK